MSATTKATAAPATAVSDPHRLDGLLYRLRGLGSAVECIGVLLEVGHGDNRDADDALQTLGADIRAAVAEVREEVERITGKSL